MAKLIVKGRLAFPKLFKPEAFNGDGEKKYGASILIPKTDAATIKKVEDAMLADAIEKWGPEKGPKAVASLKAAGKVFFRDGESKADYDGFEDAWFISASAKAKPTVVDKDKSPISEESGRIYAGCYVNVILSTYAQDNGWGKRLNATLTGVQFAGDGDAFSGGRPASTDDFEDLSTDDDTDF
jgi:hypothetical protein